MTLYQDNIRRRQHRKEGCPNKSVSFLPPPPDRAFFKTMFLKSCKKSSEILSNPVRGPGLGANYVGVFENATPGLLIITCQQSCGKVMFSVVFVCPQGGIITHDALEFTMQGPISTVPPPKTWDLTIQGPRLVPSTSGIW